MPLMVLTLSPQDAQGSFRSILRTPRQILHGSFAECSAEGIQFKCWGPAVVGGSQIVANTFAMASVRAAFARAAPRMQVWKVARGRHPLNCDGFWTLRSSSRVKGVNRRRNRACGGRHPYRFRAAVLPSRVKSINSQTDAAPGVAILITFVAFGLAFLRCMSRVSTVTVTELPAVGVAILVTILAFGASCFCCMPKVEIVTGTARLVVAILTIIVLASETQVFAVTGMGLMGFAILLLVAVVELGPEWKVQWKLESPVAGGTESGVEC